jgi:hypothetical protein
MEKNAFFHCTNKRKEAFWPLDYLPCPRESFLPWDGLLFAPLPWRVRLRLFDW